MQVGSAKSKCSAGKLQANYPERQYYHPHQEAYQHGSWRIGRFPYTAKYAASFIANPNETPVNLRELDVYQLRQRVYKRPIGFNNSWPCERRRFRKWLPKKPVQF